MNVWLAKAYQQQGENSKVREASKRSV